MGITLSDIIYAIIKGENGKLTLKTYPLTLDREPSDSELRQYFNYSVSLGDQYASDLRYLRPNESLLSTRSYRRTALAFQQTTNRIEMQNEVVAISHRRGGWKTFTWNYNDDISFEVYSNFGYGSCSELISRFFYKGIQLTPYSDYVRYRYANFSQLIHYTYNYRLEYSEWRKLMNDTLVFYNAVYDNQENEVFRWMRVHLNQMMNGLEKILTQTSYYFHRPNNSSECVSGDELEEIKAMKIGGAVEFVENIKELPHQIRPQEYLDTLFAILDKYSIHAVEKERLIMANISTLEQQDNQLSCLPILSIYDKLHKRHYYKDYWYMSSHKRAMIRYLLTLHNRLNRPFSKEDILSGIKQIPNLLEKREKIRNELFGKKQLLQTLREALKKISTFKETQSKKQ